MKNFEGDLTMNRLMASLVWCETMSIDIVNAGYGVDGLIYCEEAQEGLVRLLRHNFYIYNALTL